MNLLSESDLLLAGWQPGPQLQAMLGAVAEMEARGIRDREYAMKLLRRGFPPPAGKLGMREAPAPLAEAIVPQSGVEARNVAAVRRQMEVLLRVPVIARGAIMPDACPAGPAVGSMPVGGVVAVENAIIPSAHSEDICCSMHASFFRSTDPVAAQLDALMASTRFGPGGRAEDDRVAHPVLDEEVWDNPFLSGLERHAAMHLADQGDGNHFAFLGEMSFGPGQQAALQRAGHGELAERLASAGRWQVLVTHHGSRGLGAQVYKRGQVAAAKHTAKVARGIPAAACWLDAQSEEGSAYWEALQYVSRWTKVNHQCIHARFAKHLGTRIEAAVGNEHNFVWRRGGMFHHGKGATPAWRDAAGRPQLGLIPLHMAAPILLVSGGDNPEFLGFAPHGAGRNVSRRAAMKPYRDLDRQAVASLVAQQTPGLEIRWWHGRPDLSETPLAYKSAAQVKAQIIRFGLAEVIGEIQPLGCIMAGDPGPRNRGEELTPKQLRQIEHRADRRKSRQQLHHWEDEEM